MLRAGVVHGDLSEFNILVGSAGPVIIDLPQAVDAAGNNPRQHAAARRRQPAQLLRPFRSRSAATDYGSEIWSLYEGGGLNEDSMLTGSVAANTRIADVAGVMREIADVRAEHEARLRYKAELAGR